MTLKRIQNPDGSVSIILDASIDAWLPAIPAATVDPYAPKPEPAKLYCPSHGKMETDDMGVPAQFYMGGKTLCPKCVTEALERIGVHQLSDKPNQVTKKW